MRLTSIVLLCILLAVLAWVLWIASKPKGFKTLDSQERAVLDELMPRKMVGGNSITTYTSLAGMFDTLMDDVAGAQHHVHMEFFKFEDDATGRIVGDALAGRVAGGVECRLLYDDFMCRHWRPLYRGLRERGVETAGYNPVHWPIPIKRDYYRNHRKIVVVDGRVGYLGGVNIADRYLHGLPWGCWRDTMIRIEGPAVAALQRLFITDWRYATGRLLASPCYFPSVATVGQLALHLIPSGPVGDGPAIMHYTVELLERAEHYIWFESPYFIPTAPVRRALLDAAQRGVDVRVLLPPRGDRGEGTQLASKSYFAEAMAAGIRIGHYQPGYMHSKIIVCDDTTAVVGSCNIDPRSYELCQEVAAVIDSGEYTLQLKAVFLADEAQSVYVDPTTWPDRPCKQKLFEQITRLASSHL